MTSSLTRAEKAQRLRDIGAERILVKDGPYGSMIQSYRLDEEGFRGVGFVAQARGGQRPRFRDHLRHRSHPHVASLWRHDGGLRRVRKTGAGADEGG